MSAPPAKSSETKPSEQALTREASIRFRSRCFSRFLATARVPPNAMAVSTISTLTGRETWIDAGGGNVSAGILDDVAGKLFNDARHPQVSSANA